MPIIMGTWYMIHGTMKLIRGGLFIRACRGFRSTSRSRPLKLFVSRVTSSSHSTQSAQAPMAFLSSVEVLLTCLWNFYMKDPQHTTHGALPMCSDRTVAGHLLKHGVTDRALEEDPGSFSLSTWHVRVWMYEYVWICMNMYEYVWICMNMYEYVWICIYIFIYIYAYTYTCIYVYLHTCIHQFPRISFCWVHIEHCISIVLWCRLFMSRWNYGKPIPPMVLLFGPQTQRNLKCFSGCTERTDFIQWVNPVKEIAWNRWKYVIFAQLYGLFVWCSFY